MGRRAGRFGRIYLGIASSAATAEPLPFVAKYNIKWSTTKIKVTAMGDNNNVYLGGIKDASGSWSGFYDDATQQSYTAAGDGQPRKFYLYPDLTNVPTNYFFGQVIVDMSVDSDVDGAINMSADWAAYSDIIRLP
jgi:hypothetical protein